MALHMVQHFHLEAPGYLGSDSPDGCMMEVSPPAVCVSILEERLSEAGEGEQVSPSSLKHLPKIKSLLSPEC